MTAKNMKSHHPNCELGDRCTCDAIDEAMECQICGGTLEEDGICENFLCPDYVAPNENSLAND
jgi:hypothetical protein